MTLNRKRGPGAVDRSEVSSKIFDADYVLLLVHSAGYVYQHFQMSFLIFPAQEPLVFDHY
jgi:hypothetical protein